MILYKYILRNHAVPFLFSAAALMGVFILNFVMKFADRLVGKGLSVWVIVKLISLNLAWMVVLVIPMATLVATLMAFGSMSQNNEIAVLKASGVSLYRMMIAPLAVSFVIGYLLLIFNNDVLPDANHQAKVLGQDISRLKPTLSLEPGVFSQEISNYSILVRDLNNQTNELFGVTIYDYSTPGKANVITAKKGRLFFSKDQTKLIMELYSGEIHESDADRTGLYRKLVFDKHRILMPAEQFTFQQSGPGSASRGERELSASAMGAIVDSLSKIKSDYVNSLKEHTKKYLPAKATAPSVPHSVKYTNEEAAYNNALSSVRAARNIILSDIQRISYMQNEINKYLVEIYKKYALPVACIVFVLIGAPLGTMTKRGGFGVAASVSMFFFLIYWAFLIGGEKLAERSILSPFWGMWAANVLIGIAGIILTYVTVKETITLDFSFLKKFVPKHWRQQNSENENLQ